MRLTSTHVLTLFNWYQNNRVWSKHPSVLCFSFFLCLPERTRWRHVKRAASAPCLPRGASWALFLPLRRSACASQHWQAGGGARPYMNEPTQHYMWWFFMLFWMCSPWLFIYFFVSAIAVYGQRAELFTSPGTSLLSISGNVCLCL